LTLVLSFIMGALLLRVIENITPATDEVSRSRERVCPTPHDIEMQECSSRPAGRSRLVQMPLIFIAGMSAASRLVPSFKWQKAKA
jgi:hypothetical protein